MPKRLSMSEASKRIADVARIAQADRLDVMKLIKVAGLDPATDFRFENWSGISFTGLDLSRFDFTGARLHGCDFKGSRIAGARFDQAELGQVIYRPGRDPHRPAEMTPMANLREARDWDEYVEAWQRSPGPLPADDHLPTGAIFQDAPFAPELVVVPAGRFWMGAREGEEGASEDELPRHEVAIPGRLAVGRFAVTFEEWDAAVAAGAKDVPRIKNAPFGRGRQPVVNVSWQDAKAYAAWLSETTGRNYRLLSEAEWEYCCRAGTETPFWCGPTISKTQANYHGRFIYGRGRKSEDRQRTVPVDSFEPNAWGLYQVHGNVWEWCEDFWHLSYADKPELLKETGGAWTAGGDTSLRVLRGGSWVNDPGIPRLSSRSRGRPAYRYDVVGFRVARTL